MVGNQKYDNNLAPEGAELLRGRLLFPQEPDMVAYNRAIKEAAICRETCLLVSKGLMSIEKGAEKLCVSVPDFEMMLHDNMLTWEEDEKQCSESVF